jgi:hypothetical protein
VKRYDIQIQRQWDSSFAIDVYSASQPGKADATVKVIPAMIFMLGTKSRGQTRRQI